MAIEKLTTTELQDGYNTAIQNFSTEIQFFTTTRQLLSLTSSQPQDLVSQLSGVYCVATLANTTLAGTDYGLFGGRDATKVSDVLAILYSPLLSYSEDIKGVAVKSYPGYVNSSDRLNSECAMFLAVTLGLANGIEAFSSSKLWTVIREKIPANTDLNKFLYLEKDATITDIMKKYYTDIIPNISKVKSIVTNKQVSTGRVCLGDIKTIMTANNSVSIIKNKAGRFFILYKYDSNGNWYIYHPGHSFQTLTESEFADTLPTNFYHIDIFPVTENGKVAMADRTSASYQSLREQYGPECNTISIGSGSGSSSNIYSDINTSEFEGKIPPSGNQMTWPLGNIPLTITSPWASNHHAIDLGSPNPTSLPIDSHTILAPMDGTVIFKYSKDGNDNYYNSRPSGNQLHFLYTIDNNKYRMLFFHVQQQTSMKVKYPNEQSVSVSKGDIIGHVGNTGNGSTTRTQTATYLPHLHWQLHTCGNDYEYKPDYAGSMIHPIIHIKKYMFGIKDNNPSKDEIIAEAKTLGTTYNVPFEITYAVAMCESTGIQFKNGRPLISKDKGVGMMQITGNPVSGIDQAKLKNDWKYNLEIGIKTLKNKWDTIQSRISFSNPNWRILEHWYFAIWAYNGYSKENNPAEYNGQPRKWSNQYTSWTIAYPYQEKVFRTIESAFGLKLGRPDTSSYKTVPNPLPSGTQPAPSATHTTSM